jgi:hypothetical protein
MKAPFFLYLASHNRVSQVRVPGGRGMHSFELSELPLRLCLSGRAGLSIILPTPQWKPWYRLPVTPVHNCPQGWLTNSVSECMNIDLHFGNSQEH